MNNLATSALVALVAVIVGPIVRYFWRRYRVTHASVDQQMALFAARAIADAARRNVKLDYSVESIEQVEALLHELHDVHAAHERWINPNVYAVRFGAYVGEAIRRNDENCKDDPNCGWKRDHKVAGPNSFPLHWREGEMFPIAWCYKRIVDGEDDNVWVKYKVFRDQIARGALAQK